MEWRILSSHILLVCLACIIGWSTYPERGQAAHPLSCHYQEYSILAIWQQIPRCHEKLLICHLQNVQNILTNTSYGPSGTLFDSNKAS